MFYGTFFVSSCPDTNISMGRVLDVVCCDLSLTRGREGMGRRMLYAIDLSVTKAQRVGYIPKRGRGSVTKAKPPRYHTRGEALQKQRGRLHTQVVSPLNK